jgi:hypothetical protein
MVFSRFSFVALFHSALLGQEESTSKPDNSKAAQKSETYSSGSAAKNAIYAQSVHTNGRRGYVGASGRRLACAGSDERFGFRFGNRIRCLSAKVAYTESMIE